MKLLSDLFYAVFVVVLYWYVSRLVGGSASPLMAKYECDYFTFVMVGVALANFLQAGMQTYTENVRRFMAEGSLEAMFATPTPPYALILYSSVWPVLYAAAKTALQFGTAGLVFGFTLTRAHWFSAALSLALSAVMFTALGVISASLLVVVKRGDPVNWLFIQMSHLFGGVLFPIEMLPDWGRVLSYAFPIRYALQSTRGALLTGLSPAALAPELLTLLAFDAVAIPFSWLACTVLIDRAKRSGTLSLF